MPSQAHSFRPCRGSGGGEASLPVGEPTGSVPRLHWSAGRPGKKCGATFGAMRATHACGYRSLGFIKINLACKVMRSFVSRGKRVVKKMIPSPPREPLGARLAPRGDSLRSRSADER
jgi:hypothetical protein